MGKTMMETRAFDFEIRAEKREDGVGQIVGRPIVYDSPTDLGEFTEVIAKGALDRANLKDVRFLVNHNTAMIPLARSRNNNDNSTMQMKVGSEGMDIRVDLDVDNNTDAKNLYSAIERGDISGMSFMFLIEEEKWSNLKSDHPTRTITKISDVFEVSAVTWPAYESTSIGIRDMQALESAKAALESARKSLESEERVKALEEFNNKWRAK